MADPKPYDPRYPGHGYEAGATDHEHGHGGVGKYVVVFIALLVLTAISFAVGNSQSLKEHQKHIDETQKIMNQVSNSK